MRGLYYMHSNILNFAQNIVVMYFSSLLEQTGMNSVHSTKRLTFVTELVFREEE